MAKQTRSRVAWRCFLLLLGGLSWLSSGCNPQSLSMFLMPFTDNKIEPEGYKLFAEKDKEVTLVVVANFKEAQFQEEIRPAEKELPEQVSMYLRKRCEENKQKLKLIPQAQVRSYQLKQIADESECDPVDMGKHFKADFVLQMEIQSFRIYEPKSYPKMFRASAQINLKLYKVKAKDDDGYVVFEKSYNPEYPKEPIQADRGSAGQFRRMFLEKASREMTRLFLAYSPDEKREHTDLTDGRSEQ